MEGSDLLILKRDRQPPRVVMDFERFTRLLRWTLAEHYDHETCRDVLEPSLWIWVANERVRDHLQVDNGYYLTLLQRSTTSHVVTSV